LHCPDNIFQRDKVCITLYCFVQDCALVVTLVEGFDNIVYEVMATYEEEDPANGAIDDGNHYVAVGISDDQKMGQDSAIVSIDKESVNLYYNFVVDDYYNSFAVGDDSPILLTFLVMHGSGSLYSSFSTLPNFSFLAPTPVGPVFVNVDFASGQYILASAGPSGEVGKHSIKAFSDTPVVFWYLCQVEMIEINRIDLQYHPFSLNLTFFTGKPFFFDCHTRKGSIWTIE